MANMLAALANQRISGASATEYAAPSGVDSTWHVINRATLFLLCVDVVGDLVSQMTIE
jgi:hypothetical protein